MKSLEKTAVVRVLVDLIKADRIIDTGEMMFYEAMRRKYGFSQEHEVAALSMSFSEAIAVLRCSDRAIRTALLSDCASATVSDGFCAHSETLLLISLQKTLAGDGECVNVVSIPQKSFSVDDLTVLYVESMFDESAKYNEKIHRFQKQYEQVYHFMGGDKEKVPDVCAAEIRHPIFSRIKKSLQSMSSMLYNVNDYLISKKSFGTYNVNVESDAVFVKDWKTDKLVPLSETDIWSMVEAWG